MRTKMIRCVYCWAISAVGYAGVAVGEPGMFVAGVLSVRGWSVRAKGGVNKALMAA